MDSPNQILLALAPSDMKLLAPHLKNTLFEQGNVLLEQGQRITNIYFPGSGMISLVIVMEDGTSIEAAAIGKEGIIGPTLANGTGTTPMQAIVQVAGKGSYIKAEHFYAAVHKSERLRALIGQHGEAMLAQIVRTVACNAKHMAEARLSRWLLMVHDRVDGDTIHLTQEFLGQMLGVQRTTVTLVARALQTAGLIKYRRGHIEVVDREGLEEAACECYEINRRHFDRLMSLRKPS
jgi:CRP-like cAMP-binding protein